VCEAAVVAQRLDVQQLDHYFEQFGLFRVQRQGYFEHLGLVSDDVVLLLLGPGLADGTNQAG
jgi:hypothetical protein